MFGRRSSPFEQRGHACLKLVNAIAGPEGTSRGGNAHRKGYHAIAGSHGAYSFIITLPMRASDLLGKSGILSCSISMDDDGRGVYYVRALDDSGALPPRSEDSQRVVMTYSKRQP